MVAEDFEFRISYFFLGGSWGPRIREQVRKGLLNSQSISSSESVWQRGKDDTISNLCLGGGEEVDS